MYAAVTVQEPSVGHQRPLPRSSDVRLIEKLHAVDEVVLLSLEK